MFFAQPESESDESDPSEAQSESNRDDEPPARRRYDEEYDEDEDRDSSRERKRQEIFDAAKKATAGASKWLTVAVMGSVAALLFNLVPLAASQQNGPRLDSVTAAGIFVGLSTVCVLVVFMMMASGHLRTLGSEGIIATGIVCSILMSLILAGVFFILFAHNRQFDLMQILSLVFYGATSLSCALAAIFSITALSNADVSKAYRHKYEEAHNK